MSLDNSNIINDNELSDIISQYFPDSNSEEIEQKLHSLWEVGNRIIELDTNFIEFDEFISRKNPSNILDFNKLKSDYQHRNGVVDSMGNLVQTKWLSDAHLNRSRKRFLNTFQKLLAEVDIETIDSDFFNLIIPKEYNIIMPEEHIIAVEQIHNRIIKRAEDLSDTINMLERANKIGEKKSKAYLLKENNGMDAVLLRNQINSKKEKRDVQIQLLLYCSRRNEFILDIVDAVYGEFGKDFNMMNNPNYKRINNQLNRIRMIKSHLERTSLSKFARTMNRRRKGIY